MRTLSPSSIARLYMPTGCELRTWLKFQGEIDETPAGPFQEFLQGQGIRHEQAVFHQLATKYPDWVDIDGFENASAAEETRKAIQQRRGFIYQGQLEWVTDQLNGESVRVMGYPDFLIFDEGRYTIGDAKLARSIQESKKDGSLRPKAGKEYIVYQLQLYGWMFEKQFPDLEFDLKVFNGAGEQEVVHESGDATDVLEELRRILRIQALDEQPWEPVGWSKCSACGYFNHCWPPAREAKSLGFVPGVDQPLARRLRDEGFDSYSDLAYMDAATLADIKSPNSKTKNLAASERILENVQALVSGHSLRRRSGGRTVEIDPRILEDGYFVMFDLEGVPPDLDDWDKIYLWGMQIFGEEVGEFRPAFAGFGDNGDLEGWVEFLLIAGELFDEYPDVLFVHWAPYEKTKIEQYMDRYPDTDLKVAEKIMESLVDLLSITRRAVALPLPSYSLKAVEKLPELVQLTGFERSSDDVSKGDDSIAAYMKAAETKDESHRDRLMKQLADYNQEDLEATWAVQLWLKHLASSR